MLHHDIERQAPSAAPAPETDRPHDSAEVYSQLKGRHTLLVFPTLSHREKGKGHTLVIALIVALVVVSAWGTAYELQYNVLNRPQQLTGTCAPPAVIANGGCFIHQTSVDAQGNSHTVLVPAGVLNK